MGVVGIIVTRTVNGFAIVIAERSEANKRVEYIYIYKCGLVTSKYLPTLSTVYCDLIF